jgi:hypothetical protein
MSHDDIEREIRRAKSKAHSVDEQIEIAHAMWERGIGPGHDGIKRAETEERLDIDLEFKTKTSLKHLVDTNILEEFRRPGPNTYVLADWQDEDPFIMGEVTEVAEEAVESLIRHIRADDPSEDSDSTAIADGRGVTLREVVAEKFDFDPSAIEDCLRSADPVEKLNTAVEAIEEHDDFETREDYGEIVFINAPYRYRLTERAVSLYKRAKEDSK